MVEVVVVGTKDKEKLSSAMDTNTTTVGGNDDDDDYGEEEIKVVVMIEEEEEAGTKEEEEEEEVDDQDEKKKIKSRTSTEQTTMSTSKNVKPPPPAAAEEEEEEEEEEELTVVVDEEKLKARVKRLIMWSLVYFLLYWIRLVIKRDHYENGLIFYSSIGVTVFFLLHLMAVAPGVFDMINSLVLSMNHDNIPPPTTTTTTTTTIDRMEVGIRDSCGTILFMSFIHNCTHMVMIVLIGISLRISNQSPKSGEDSLFQMLYAGCIFFAIGMHYTYWKDNFHV